MADTVIPQRELRNNVAAVLRATEAGETFTITVRGRAVAQLGPPPPAGEPRLDVDRATLRRLLAEPIDLELGAQLDALEEPLDHPRTG